MAAKIRMYTTTWCPDCRRAKYFLALHGIEVEEINIENTEEAVEFVMAANCGKRRVPTFEIDGRTFYCSPYDPEKLKHELGLSSPKRSYPSKG
ncbi:MAG: glutaredoxin family protein [Terriglobia bacterium]